jgi:hypothetical protein
MPNSILLVQVTDSKPIACAEISKTSEFTDLQMALALAISLTFTVW